MYTDAPGKRGMSWSCLKAAHAWAIWAAGAQPVLYPSHLGVTSPQKTSAVISFSMLGAHRCPAGFRGGVCCNWGNVGAVLARKTCPAVRVMPSDSALRGPLLLFSNLANWFLRLTFHMVQTPAESRGPIYWATSKTSAFDKLHWDINKNK